MAGAITLGFAVVSLVLPRGHALTAIDDTLDFLLTFAVSVVMLWNAWAADGTTRRFWVLMSAGCFLWSANLGGWLYYEGLQRIKLPDPWSMDICLFLHLIPMLAAIGLRPHRTESEQKFRLGTFDFLLLLVWWTFLYAFTVFPAQYVAVDTPQYDHNFAVLYLVESGVLVLGLGIVARGASSGWKALYLNLMVGNVVYAIASQAVNLADMRGIYYTGSLFDVGLIAAISWTLATVLSARKWELDSVPPHNVDKWGTITLQLTMLAILSLPVLGLWTFLWDHSSASTRTFRLFTVLAAMLVLGAFLFMRQYFQDQALIGVLENSRLNFETEQRLQGHLVQREKLASLGELVAGAAHEIDHPLTAIMDYSEKLWSLERLTPEQDALVRKIVHHSQRTRELVTNLLSFAQQRSGEKKMVDLCVLLQRSVQMRELQHHDQKIHIELTVEPDLPQVHGDGHQLFQVFVQIVENAVDALEEAGGGVLRVSAQLESGELVVQFSDNGPGIKDPRRVFDPFYTTKPIGKGSGLGLSAVYGVVQDHQGQITCQNNPQGGALFTLRLPVANEASQALAATQS
jgi:signal transduction histidine kinase